MIRFYSVARIIAQLALLLILRNEQSYAANIDVGVAENGSPYMVFNGNINEGDANTFHQLLDNYQKLNKPIESLILNSSGGSVFEGTAIVNDILNYKLNTIVLDGDVCASACFALFAAGKLRMSYPNSKIGVHRASLQGIDNDMARGTSIDMLKLYSLLNVPDDIQLAMIKTEPNSIYWLNLAQKKKISYLQPNISEAKEVVEPYVQPRNTTATKEQRLLARKLNEQGIQYIRTNQFTYAVNVLEQSKSIYPTDAEVLGNLGYAYFMLQDLTKAEYNLTSSLKIKENRGSTWNNLGLVKSFQGDVNWATKCFINYWNYSKNKKAATDQFFYWEAQRPGTYLDQASKNARQALGIYGW